MKYETFFKKTLLITLAFFILLNTMLPMHVVYADNVSAFKMDQRQPISDFTVVAPESAIAVAGLIVKGIPSAIKAIGAINYATENHKYASSESWTSIALSYFSGNAYVKPVHDVRAAMQAGFEMTNQSIKELQDQVATLQEDVNQLSADLDKAINIIEAKDLKARLDDFYTNFFMPAYTNLIVAYNAVGHALGDKNTNEATLRAKLDDLFMKANELKRMDSYITGTAFFDNSGILDVCYDYLLRAKEVTREESDTYYAVAGRAQDFAMNLFAASALQKVCTAYASSYQLHYFYEHYDEMVENNEFVGYIVGGTSHLSTNKFTEYEIKENIAHAYDDIQVISGEVAKNLTKIHMLDSFVGYVEEGSAYYAPVVSSKVAVYPGATYHLFSIPDELSVLFQEDFSFVSDNAAVSVSPNGVFTFDGTLQTSFKISYVYGKGVIDTPITIYEITFVPSARTFSGGYGHEKSPYLISNLDQLKNFASNSAYHASGVHVRLMSDINLTGVQLSKIAEYYGVFDGNGYKLYGTSDNYVLFNKNNGTIKNLTISDSKLSFSIAGNSIGGIIAITNTGKIINCHVKNSSMTLYSHNYVGGSSGYTRFSVVIGGIAAKNSGTIEYCTVDNTTVKAEASSRELYDAKDGLKQMYFENGTVITISIDIGGIAGENSGKINNCYVNQSTLNSTIYAAYYKLVILWDTTINEVDATIRSGNIIGSNSGESDSNAYNNVGVSCDIKKIAGNTNRKDDSLVTSNIPGGINGTNTTSHNAYIKSISVSLSPMQEKYLSGATFNFAGLKVIGNMGNVIYGYKFDGFTSATAGEYKIKLSYKDFETSFTVKVGCEHKHIHIDEGISPTCLEDGKTIGVYCLTCKQYIDQSKTLSKSNEYCYDDDTNHKCDLCGREVSTCADNDKNHLCDFCGAEVSKCVDTDDHFCDICGDAFGECIDSDANYRCDICGANLCICKDDNKDHFCDICKYRITDCLDNNLDHVCDVCNAIVCTDPDKNHKCNICASVVGTHKAGENTHLCDYCGLKASDCTDLNFDHVCDICRAIMSTHQGIEGSHMCSYCGQQMSNCSDSNNDHFCDICNAKISECNVAVGSHTCSVCAKVVSQCVDANNDHLCEVCLSLLSSHRDLNEDSKCDVCGNDIKENKTVDPIVIVTAASTVGVCGLGFGLWFLLKKKKMF